MTLIPTTTEQLSSSLLDLVEAQLAALARGPLPAFELPSLLLGHPVGADVRADLLFTLGLLHEAGLDEVDGMPVVDAITRLLANVRGRETHTFYSYRVAETVARFGTAGANSVLATLAPAALEQVVLATDSTDWLELLDAGVLPRNYAAVLARCENARLALGLLEDRTVLDDLLERVRSLLGGHLDDSNTAIGRYDIYTVDIYLFCEPLAGLLGERWREGARAALDLVDRVASRDGSAVAWGRSTGVLAACHTIELGGLVMRHDLVDDPDRWLARAAGAASTIGDWFDDGWVTAHQHRTSDPYRGLDRRLQLTLDCLGKLVDAALGLRGADGTVINVADSTLFPDRDEVVWFDRHRHAGVWSFRSLDTAFVLPLVGGTTTDYLPAPRNPGLHEAPVGSALATATPLVLHGGTRFVGGGLPVAVEHVPGKLHARYDGFPEAGHLEPGPDTPRLAGTRAVTWRVDGRTLTVEEELEFERPPHGIVVQVSEASDRPLRFEADCDGDATTATVDVSGIAEYRSCWGELARLHQVDVRPATSVRFRWSVTPLLRIVSTGFGHHYNDSLYRPLADRTRVGPLPFTAATQPEPLRALAAQTDQFHLHWPEWTLPIGHVDAHRRLIDGLRSGGVRIVWTQHNLTSHMKDTDSRPVYQAWAAAADLVLHHSDWGRRLALDTYDYGVQTRHVVIPHAHWGRPDLSTDGTRVRRDVEQEMGLRGGVLRLGIIGAPRAEKDVELVMRAVARSRRDDIELLVLSLRGDEEVPDDPRIIARPYEMVTRDEYDRRLSAFDALVMPFDPEGEMLATGTVGDAVGFGLPTIASSWPYLTEALGEAAITYGSTEDDLVACLDHLDGPALDDAAAAARLLRPILDWSTIAEATYAELDRLGSGHH